MTFASVRSSSAPCRCYSFFGDLLWSVLSPPARSGSGQDRLRVSHFSRCSASRCGGPTRVDTCWRKVFWYFFLWWSVIVGFEFGTYSVCVGAGALWQCGFS